MPWAQAHGPHPPARWAASAQFTNTTCHIEPPLAPFDRSLHQLRLDRVYSSWLTNYSPPKRLRPGNRGLAPTALKMPPLPGLRTHESALIGVKKQVSQPLCSRELSSKSYWLFSPGRGDILNAVGASPRPASARALGGERTVHQHNLFHRAAIGSIRSKSPPVAAR